MKPRNPALIEAAREVYVKDPRRPSLRTVAKELGVCARTLYRYSAQEGWVAQREEHCRQVVQEAVTKEEVSQTSRQAAQRGRDELDRSYEILRFMRDGLTGAYRLAIEMMVATRNADEKKQQEILARWGQLSPNEILRFLYHAPRTLSEILRAMELLKGQPTERIKAEFFLEGEVRRWLADEEFVRLLEAFSEKRGQLFSTS